MDPVEFSTLLFLGSLLAGLIGATSGLGGGVILMPLLALFFKVDLLYAIGGSLMGVIVTSLGSSIHFLKKDLVDIRTAAKLETGTVPGAIGGAILATMIHEGIIFVIFGLILIFSIIESKIDKPNGQTESRPKHLFIGWLLMLVAGLFSGLLGIGSGAFKVIAMDRVMKMPFRISTATSSFMIGVTAAASASTFYHMGYIDSKIVVALVPGVLLGSLIGAKMVSTLHIKHLRTIFSFIIFLLALELIVEGLARMWE